MMLRRGVRRAIGLRAKICSCEDIILDIRAFRICSFSLWDTFFLVAVLVELYVYI